MVTFWFFGFLRFEGLVGIKCAREKHDDDIKCVRKQHDDIKKVYDDDIKSASKSSMMMI